MEKINYTQYLADVIKCQQMQDPEVKHEWLFDERASAVRVANYLRNSGYVVELKAYLPLGTFTVYYVGVPFETLRIR